MTDGLSASDVALLQGDKNGNNYGGFGGDGAWMIVLFLILPFWLWQKRKWTVWQWQRFWIRNRRIHSDFRLCQHRAQD